MEQLRVRTLASHPSFSSLGSGSSGYFTPVCGLIDHEFTPEIDRHSLTSRVSHQDMEVFCKNSKPGFVKRLGLAGKRICSGGKHALANKSKKKQGHPVKQTVHRSASSFTVVATAVSAVQRELVCDEHACNRVHSRVEEYKPEESRSSCRVYGLGASSHEEEPTAANVIKDESKEVSSQAPVSVEKLKSMSGTWQLVKSMSGGIQQLCDLLELGWVLRKALDNSDIIEIDINDERILQTAKVFKLVEIVEEFPLNGEERSFRRRDLRRGRLYAQTQITQSGYKTSLRWDEPCEGGMSEAFSFTNDGQSMYIDVHAWRANGGSCKFQTFWSRKI